MQYTMEVFKPNYVMSDEQRPLLKTYGIAVTSLLVWTALALHTTSLLVRV